ncbi:hypothetical protein BCR43DRAFT_513090 [Syncephalastrum racemosum]|uniref:Uncharacterized protein n=1 Tax=Syncephalastrum racemosum TaxID=13706 RepID=A0A1X2HIP0_SYNRA|nr:hypothetical protein BCR43DRAFT_513090 [Syncephalastrum racemosum]
MFPAPAQRQQGENQLDNGDRLGQLPIEVIQQIVDLIPEAHAAIWHRSSQVAFPGEIKVVLLIEVGYEGIGQSGASCRSDEKNF